MSTPAITPQPTQQPQAQPTQSAEPVNMVSSNGSDARQIPTDQVDAAKKAGWEPAVKMYDSGDKANLRWIPVSKVNDAHNAGWYPALTQAQKAKVEGDAIQSDPVGNAIITGGAGLAKAGVDAGLSALGDSATGQVVEDVADQAGEYAEYGAQAAKDAVKQGVAKVGEFAEENAGKMNDMLTKFGENYPELNKLASKLGYSAAGAGTTVAAWELLKHIMGAGK